MLQVFVNIGETKAFERGLGFPMQLHHLHIRSAYLEELLQFVKTKLLAIEALAQRGWPPPICIFNALNPILLNKK